MWIELIKKGLASISGRDNNMIIMALSAMGFTLLAVFGLKYTFCEIDHYKRDDAKEESNI